MIRVLMAPIIEVTPNASLLDLGATVDTLPFRSLPIGALLSSAILRTRETARSHLVREVALRLSRRCQRNSNQFDTAWGQDPIICLSYGGRHHSSYQLWEGS